jgi:hypothetical protein
MFGNIRGAITKSSNSKGVMILVVRLASSPTNFVAIGPVVLAPRTQTYATGLTEYGISKRSIAK